MTKQEREQFEALIVLYSDVIPLKEEFHVARFADMGYLGIQYVGRDGCIEQSFLYRTPQEMYEFLENEWEIDWLYRYAEEIGVKEVEYELFKRNMPRKKVEELKDLHKMYQERAKEILGM